MPTATDTAESMPVNVGGDEGTQDVAPDTDLVTTAEAEGAVDSTETEDSPSSPLDSIDDDSLRTHPRITKLLKDIEARSAESARQKSEVETARRLQQQHTEFVTRGGVAQATERAIQKAIDSGNTRDALDEIQKISNAVYVANTKQNMDAFDATLAELIPEGATIPAKRAEDVDRIRDAVLTGRKTPEDLIRARIELLRDMTIEARLPELRKQWAAEQKKQAAAAQKTQAERDADSTRAGQSQPTGISGAGGARQSFNSIRELDAAIERGAVELPRGPSSRKAYDDLARGLPY